MILLDDPIIKKSIQLIIVCIALTVLLITGAFIAGIIYAILGG